MKVASCRFVVDIARASRIMHFSECPTPPMAVGRIAELSSRLIDAGADPSNADEKRTSSGSFQPRRSKRRRQFFEDPAQRYAAAVQYYSASGQWRELLDMTNNEIATSETDACTYCLRAAALLHTGNPLEAIADCDQALLLDDDLSLAYSIRAHCFYEVGDHASASADFRRLMDAQPIDNACDSTP